MKKDGTTEIQSCFLTKKGEIWKKQYEIQYNTEMGSILCWNQTGQNPVLGIPSTTKK